MSPNDLLIVDDNPENLRVIGDMLRGKGYRVRPVTSGPLALKVCAAQPPELILLDIAMPEMNGFEVCTKLKADPKLKEIPVLFISAHTEPIDKVRAFQAGGVDYITKPFNIEEVEARVLTHLSLHRQRQEIQANYNRIRELEETRKNLNSLIVHDLRSPLSAVQAFMDMLDQHNPDFDATSKRLLQSARDASRHLLDMTNSLLDLNRLESHAMQLNIEPVDVAELCREAVSNATSFIEHRNVTVECGVYAPIAEVDRDLMRRIIQNVLGNALKFTNREDGKIALKIESSDDKIIVSIADNGPGIPAEYHQRIFEKFVQVDDARIPGVHSTGLGLSLVKLGTEAHGGTVSLESELGKGTTFWITIPRKHTKAA